MGKIVRIVVSVALLSFLAYRTDWAHVGQAFANLRVGFWLAAVGLLFGAQLISGLRWQVMARQLGFHLPLRRFVGFYFIGLWFNLVLPTSVGGDVVRACYLNPGAGRRMAAFLSVLADRISGLLVLLSLACIGVLLCPLSLPAWIYGSVAACAGGAVVGMAALLILTRWVQRWNIPNPAGKMGKALVRCRDLTVGLRQTVVMYLRRPGLLVGATGLSLLVQAISVTIVWLVGKAIAAPVPGAYYWILAPMVSLLTLLPVSVNGMGVREAGVVLFLAPLGVSEGSALSLAFLWFLVNVTVSLSGGAVYLFGSFPRPEVQSEHDSVGDRSDQGRERQSRAAA